MRGLQQGFTLIELMITVAVIGILAAVAYPSYTEYVMRSRRVEGQTLLDEAAARQERWRAQNGKYTVTVTDLKLPHGATSQNGYYMLVPTAMEDGSDGGYTLKAQRLGSQTSDFKCGDFTLDAKGKKGIAAGTPGTAANCWR